MRRTLTLALTGVAVLLTACAGTDTAAGPTDEEIAGTWDLTVGTIDGRDLPINGQVSLMFDNGEVGGTAACNQYFGRVERDGERISMGELGWTEMGCDEPRMATEQAYLGALPRVDTIARDGEQLVLSGDGVELRFAPVPPVKDAEIVGTVWELNGLIEGSGPEAAVSSVGGERAILEFTEDGRFGGSTGCRTFTGTYEISGAEIVATQLATDDRACPDELARQDQHVLETLGDGFRAEVEGERMVLASGDVGLAYVVAPTG